MQTAISVVSAYHDILLSKRLEEVPTLPGSPFGRATERQKETTGDNGHAEPDAPKTSQQATRPAPSAHARYTQYFCAKSPVYRRAARLLVVIGYVQLLLEMLVVRRGRRGPKSRWTMLLWLEGLKWGESQCRGRPWLTRSALRTFLRLTLLSTTNRSVLSHPIALREYDPTMLTSSFDDPVDPAANTPATPLIPTLRPGPPASTYLVPLIPLLPEAYQPSPLTLLPELSSAKEVLGEVIHASRGFVHVALMLYLARRTRQRPTSPSYLSLASPLPATLIPLGLLLLARSCRPSRSPSAQTTLVQAAEEQARDKELVWWALKGWLYAGWTRPKIDSWIKWSEEDKRWKRWTGLGLAAGLLQQHQKLVEELYYCESGEGRRRGC